MTETTVTKGVIIIITMIDCIESLWSDQGLRRRSAPPVKEAGTTSSVPGRLPLKVASDGDIEVVEVGGFFLSPPMITLPIPPAGELGRAIVLEPAMSWPAVLRDIQTLPAVAAGPPGVKVVLGSIALAESAVIACPSMVVTNVGTLPNPPFEGRVAAWA